MNRLLSRLLPNRAVPLPTLALDAADAAAVGAMQASDAQALAEPPAGCGWFESSHELQQGVAVQEWPADDWAVAALYFAQLQPSSARLQ